MRIRRARSILDHHRVDPVGLAVTGLRDAARYGYEAYTSGEPKSPGDDEPLAYSGGTSVRQQPT